MTADKILKKYEDDNEYHFHTVDRKWIIEAMEEYAALRQPHVVGRSEQFICPDCKKDTIEWTDGICEDCTLKGFS